MCLRVQAGSQRGLRHSYFSRFNLTLDKAHYNFFQNSPLAEFEQINFS